MTRPSLKAKLSTAPNVSDSDKLPLMMLLWMLAKFRRIICVHLTLLLTCCLLFVAFETGHALPADVAFLANYFDAFYWANITVTSTGYGDISPKTFPGRLLAIVMVNAWIFFLVPMLVARFVSLLIRNKHQETHEEQEWSALALSRILAHHNIEMPPRPSHTEFGDVDGDSFDQR